MNIKKPLAVMALGLSIATFGLTFEGLALPQTTHAQSVSTVRQNIIKAGKKYIGTPYEFASNRKTKTTMDCSEFTYWAYKEGAHVKLPTSSRSQAAYVKRIGKTTSNWSQLKPGDLMFFMSYRGPKASNYFGINKSKQRITHVGIYMGNGLILHTYSRKAGGVKISKIDGTQWEKRFIFGGSAIR